MATIIQTTDALTAPIAGTPILPNITTGLLLDYTFDYLDATLNSGDPITSVAPVVNNTGDAAGSWDLTQQTSGANPLFGAPGFVAGYTHSLYRSSAGALETAGNPTLVTSGNSYTALAVVYHSVNAVGRIYSSGDSGNVQAASGYAVFNGGNTYAYRRISGGSGVDTNGPAGVNGRFELVSFSVDASTPSSTVVTIGVGAASSAMTFGSGATLTQTLVGLAIGDRRDSGTQYWNGNIARVTFYERALSTVEVELFRQECVADAWLV